jgi:hypothetical protein
MNSPASSRAAPARVARTPITFDEVWDSFFVQKIADIRRRHAERQTDAMVDCPVTLCGETVRQMSAMDLIILDALGNAFIAGSNGEQVEFVDLAGFVWQLHISNSHTSSLANLWRRHRLIQRLLQRDNRADARAVSEYLDKMFMDSPASSGGSADDGQQPSDSFRPEPKTHFVAPILVRAASEYGHIDPLSGELLGNIPLPRLIQYSRISDEDKNGTKHYTEIDSLRNRCVERVNQINWARRNGLPEPVFSPDGTLIAPSST